MKKLRILEITIMIIAIKLTPIAINYANEIRHYKAYGGEYLIPLLGILAVFLLETVVDIKKNLK